MSLQDAACFSQLAEIKFCIGRLYRITSCRKCTHDNPIRTFFFCQHFFQLDRCGTASQTEVTLIQVLEEKQETYCFCFRKVMISIVTFTMVYFRIISTCSLYVLLSFTALCIGQILHLDCAELPYQEQVKMKVVCVHVWLNQWFAIGEMSALQVTIICPTFLLSTFHFFQPLPIHTSYHYTENLLHFIYFQR